jgi:DNA-binding beta-propeller fold protein YncE
MTGRSRKSSQALRLVCLWLLTLTAWLGSSVCAAYGLSTEPLSENFIPRFSEYGTSAGQIEFPVGIGVSRTTGDLYVSEVGGRRVDEFSPWGRFIRAFGWGVADGVSNELQTCTTTCFTGLVGGGSGEFGAPWGVVVDPGGDNVYVMDDFNDRVQKFTSLGQFVLMFGGEVDKTQVHRREAQEAKVEPVTVTADEEDVCTQSSGDECGAGTEGSRHGQIKGTDIALSQTGGILVAGLHGLQEFSADGVYLSEISLSGRAVRRFAVDPTNGDLFVSYPGAGLSGVEDNVYKLSSTGAPLGMIEVKSPKNIATDSTGHVYVDAVNQFTKVDHILNFDSGSGHLISEFSVPQGSGKETEVYGLGTNSIGDLYVANNSSPNRISFLSAFGPPPVGFEPPPPVAPTIESEYALSVDMNSAVVQARINPRFWNDTTDYVEYGPGDCEAGGCVALPAAPGSTLTSKVVDQSVASSSIPLTGLSPETTYHYRFVSQSGGGGPVFGPDQTFRTAPAFVTDVDCPNQSLRTGFSASLPDCRAYEMVSPIEKDGGDIINLLSFQSFKNGLNQSTPGGERFTYSADRAFANSPAGLYVNQYMSDRNPISGWSTESISAPVHPTVGVEELTLETEYRYFAPDLSSGWLAPPGDLSLAPGVVGGVKSLYRHDNKTGSFEALITGVQPDEEQGLLEFEGFSADGERVVFEDQASLTADSSTKSQNMQIYERLRSGEIHLVSVLPDGLARDESSAVGSANSIASNDRLSSVKHAVSEDGSRVYWSESAPPESPGKLYLRLNADRDQSAMNGEECLEEEKACTIAVSGKPSRFVAAGTDGSKAIYLVPEGGSATSTLSEFSLEERSSIPIAKKVEGIVGESEDLSYVYFVSTEALTSDAHAGAPNLYVHHDEANSLVATLSALDIDAAYSDTTPQSPRHTARVTLDGRYVVFASTSRLTGYDNLDAISDKPDSEVYLYAAQAQSLTCVSCDRTGARPSGREIAAPDTDIFQPTAARIPGGQTQFYASRVLSEDGRRLFFESYTPLVPRDTNGALDVYEWEAPGAGSCSTDSSSFSNVNEGCVELISSGESPEASEILDATPDGSDVFFTTAASLVAQDPGSVDVYDARVVGGFSAPSAPPASCEGEACQGAPSPPDDKTPASATFSGLWSLLSPTSEVAGAMRTVVKKTAVQSRAVKLARALKQCRARAGRRKRESCEVAARKRYGTKRQVKKSSMGRGK